jgi:hypothetical protein
MLASTGSLPSINRGPLRSILDPSILIPSILDQYTHIYSSHNGSILGHIPFRVPYA